VTPGPTAADVVASLSGWRFRGHNEAVLQGTVLESLEHAGLPFIREYRINPRDRIDFLVGSVGVELKVQGRADDVRRQLERYAEAPEIRDLVLVTTRWQHRPLAGVVLGKPVVVHVVNVWL
jgi:hypothetical protein